MHKETCSPVVGILSHTSGLNGPSVWHSGALWTLGQCVPVGFRETVGRPLLGERGRTA